jgi:lipopolysaccharide export system permease protein
VKKLDWLTIKSFIGPFLLTFCIALFVLVMQFLWKYVDDLVGKGLTVWVLTELLFYASARLVPLALPIAVLLSSIMVFGSFGEFYELTAVKSAGISLLRFMQALIIFVVAISIFAFFFSNNILPMANLKFSTLLYDIRNQKPTVALKPGIFYNGLDGYFIRIEDKDEDKNTLYGMTVYDHTSGKGNDHVILADKGSMTQDDEQMALTLKLENGKQYREIDPKDASQKNNYEMVSTTFKTWEKKFDLSKFKLNHTDEEYFKDMKQMLTLSQLYDQIDTIDMETAALHQGYTNYVNNYFNYDKFGLDTLAPTAQALPANGIKDIKDILKPYDAKLRINLVGQALAQARNIKNYAEITSKQLEFKDDYWVQHRVEVFRKFTLSIACLVLFFIGAPLGSIIRKGGLGFPLAYAIVFFIVYHVSSMIGEKMAEKDVMTPFGGMWFSTFILLPIGLFLTIKATNDSKLFQPETYKALFVRIFKKSKAAGN